MTDIPFGDGSGIAPAPRQGEVGQAPWRVTQPAPHDHHIRSRQYHIRSRQLEDASSQVSGPWPGTGPILLGLEGRGQATGCAFSLRHSASDQVAERSIQAQIARRVATLFIVN